MSLNKKDLDDAIRNVTAYILEHKADDFGKQIEAEHIEPRAGVDLANWEKTAARYSDGSAASMKQADDDFVWLAENSTGHIYCYARLISNVIQNHKEELNKWVSAPTQA